MLSNTALSINCCSEKVTLSSQCWVNNFKNYNHKNIKSSTNKHISVCFCDVFSDHFYTVHNELPTILCTMDTYKSLQCLFESFSMLWHQIGVSTTFQLYINIAINTFFFANSQNITFHEWNIHNLDKIRLQK